MTKVEILLKVDLGQCLGKEYLIYYIQLKEKRK